MLPDVTAEALDDWAGALAQAVDSYELQDPLLIVALDDGSDWLVNHLPVDDVAVVESRVNAFFSDAERRNVLGWVERIEWTPLPEPAPTEPAWLLLVVGRGAPVRCYVRRTQTDTLWSQVPSYHMPWLALSTAAGLRGLLEHGTPILLKQAISPALFGTMDDEPPAEDEHGRI